MIISRFAAFFLAALLGILFLWPLFLPPGLALAEVRVYPLQFFLFLAFFAAVLGLLFWIVRTLRRETILAACLRSATKIRSLFGPALVGVAIVLITASMAAISGRNENTRRAERIAASKVG